jgi:ABC-type transport system involved in cytochrome c biogenesis ATPase subunit
MLFAQNLSCIRGDHQLLNDINLQLQPGRLLRILAGLCAPDATEALKLAQVSNHAKDKS